PPIHLPLPFLYFFHSSLHLSHLHSFPTRRSSDLSAVANSSPAFFNSTCVVNSKSLPSILTGIFPVFATNLSCDDGSSFACLKSRSEEHTSELQSRGHLVCRLLLEKKKTKI